MILTLPLPDELFVSLCVRTCRINGLSDYREFAEVYFGNTNCPSFIGAKVDLHEFCHRTENLYGDVIEVRETMSFLGLRYRLGEIEAFDPQSIDSGNGWPSLHEMTFLGTTTLKYCPDCIREDIRRHGMTYWHRVHQVPIVMLCPEHGSRLILNALRRVDLHVVFPLPGDVYVDLNHPVIRESAENDRFWRQVTGVVSDAFGSAFSTGPDLLLATIIYELASLQLANQAGSIRRKKLVALMAPLFQARDGASMFQNPDRTARLLVESLTCVDAFPFGRALWIAWLFGDWNAFLAKVHWLDVIGIGVITNDVGSRSVVLNPRGYHRNICTRFVKQYPECSRLDFTRSEYRSFRWLLHHDRAWLNEVLPIPERIARQLLLF